MVISGHSCHTAGRALFTATFRWPPDKARMHFPERVCRLQSQGNISERVDRPVTLLAYGLRMFLGVTAPALLPFVLCSVGTGVGGLTKGLANRPPPAASRQGARPHATAGTADPGRAPDEGGVGRPVTQPCVAGRLDGLPSRRPSKR